MNPNPPPSGNSKALFSIFQEQLSDILNQIETSWKYALDDEWDFEVSEQIQYLMHKLSGSSAMLGYEQIAAVAKLLSHNLQNAIEQGNPDPDLLKKIKTQLLELKEAIINDRPTNISPIDEQDLGSSPVRQSRSQHMIFLVEDDPIQGKELSSQIEHFGYSVWYFSEIADLEQALEKVTPKALLMDVIFRESRTAGPDKVFELQASLPKDLPIIFISVSSDLIPRLQAVRAGGNAYFVKPFDIVDLIDVLDRLTVHEEADPFRILIVDDDLITATKNDRILANSGMRTLIVSDPLQIMSQLLDFNPDLILLDVYMPGCSGLELASVIRQMEQFISIPIVYLSSEDDKEKQLEAMSLGGDDFLDKNIKAPHLITSVRSRAKRYRKLRELLRYDGLTGLLNHTTTKERTDHEVFRADRDNTPVSLALIDLDLFKSVNDTYGHAVGDRVLKSLSRFLKQRLRKSDIIGRVGGEEFAVILPNTKGAAAERLMNELRERFSKILHRHDNTDFSITFSCGIADFPAHFIPSSLNDAADKALYAAKHQGRNKVVYDPGPAPEV